MAISEAKMQMVIANYFKDECDVNTSIRQAFEKGFRIGVKKGASTNRPQEWIPCSERLPEIGQKVLASTKKTVFTQVFKGVYRNTDCKRWYWEHNSLKKIEAWQPLPEPWKGVANEG